MMVRDDLDALLQVTLVPGLLFPHGDITRDMLAQTPSHEPSKPVLVALS